MLTPDEVAALGGLPGPAICGVMVADAAADDEFDPAHFLVNVEFVRFLHEVLRTRGPQQADLQAAARSQKEGWLYLIDLRTPDGPQGDVPPRDIVGGFKVERGVIQPESYWPNDDHQVYTEHGLIQLAPSLRQAWLDALRQLPPTQQ